MKLEDLFQTFGLSAKQQKVYLACLQRGESTIMPIARSASLPRTSIAYILEKLDEIGLVQIVKKNNRKLYIPIPPRKILTILKQKQTELEAQAQMLTESLPELNQLLGSQKTDAQVRIYTGQLEVRQIYEELLEAPINDTWYVGDTATIRDALGDRYLKQWIKKRVAKKIHTHAIRIRRGELEDREYSNSKEGLRTVRFAPEGFNSPANILLFHNTVLVLTSSKESLGIAITSKDFFISMKSWFQELWKICEPE
jgi:sugar-specific transcriptional regulator TrmB